MISGTLLTALASTGMPIAIASITALGMPSASEGWQKMSLARSRRGTSSTWPRNSPRSLCGQAEMIA